MPCGDLIYIRLRDEILSGGFGESGSLFMQTRQLTAKYHISATRAQSIIRALMADRLLVLCGKHYYVATGPFSPDSPGYQRLRRADFPLLGIGVGSFVPIYSALIEELSSLALKAGYQTVCMYENSQLTRMLDSMLAIGVQGMFFLPKVLDFPMLLNRFVLPTVVIGKRIDGIRCDTITMDNYQAGILAAEHLLQINCASCCYVGHAHNLGIDRRHAGFETRIKNSGCQPKSILIDAPGDEQLRGYLRHTLAELPRPIGIFCYTDIFAVEVLRHIRSIGWSIPEEIRIIGCDNLPQSLTNTPPLTTIHYNCSSLAQGGMERMLERLNNHALGPCSMMISPSLFIRESTGGKSCEKGAAHD